MIEGKKMNTYHIYSEGDLVLFRDNSDKIYFNNKYAVASYKTSVDTLGSCILSTHFHTVADADNEEQVEELEHILKVSYGMYYRHKYGHTIGNNFRIKHSRVVGKENISDKLVYVMANPVHHFISESPFTEQFSSASYIFTKENMPLVFRKAVAGYVTTLGKLTTRRRLELLSKDSLPDDYYVDPEGFILPNSFINVAKARAYFNGSIRRFRYLVDTSLKDKNKKDIDECRQSVLCDGVDDEKVCAIIDRYAAECGHQSFHYFSEKELKWIQSDLRSRGISQEQCLRCLWLPSD